MMAKSITCLQISTFIRESKTTKRLQGNYLMLRETRELRVSARDRGKNRKPLQKGRNLSIEAIQTVQALKRAYYHSINNCDFDSDSVGHVFNSKFRRLLKFDMMAVLRELLRQNHCVLALKVFEDIRKEEWYKPRVSLYTDMITVMASNGFLGQVELLHMYLKTESNLQPEIEEFNFLFKMLIGYNLTTLVMECYNLMKAIGCEPDMPTLRLLINGLESIRECGASAIVREDAKRYYGESLQFLEEEEEEKDETLVSRTGKAG